MHTPWGVSDYEEKIAEGIMLYGTPSHGGIILAEDKNKIVHPAWRRPDCAYEEDCEISKVILTFPESFAPGTVKNAHKSAAHWFPVPYKTVFPKGAPL